MKVYRVRVDVNRFQYFLPEDSSIYSTDRLRFDATPMAEDWVPPPVYIYTPTHKRGNFFDFCSYRALVLDEIAKSAMPDIIEMSGELLPLPHKGELFHALNVTACFNVLDEERTEWIIGEKSKSRIGIKKYAFHPHRFAQIPLFKIPETCRGEILALEGMTDEEDEFKRRVERLGLTGLTFQEIWSDGVERPSDPF